MKSFVRFLKFLLLMLLVLAGFIFAAKNTSSVGLWLLTEHEPRPVSVWLLLAFGSGGVVGLLLGYGMWRRVRLGWQLRQLQRQLQQARNELAELRRQTSVDEPDGPN